MKSDSIPSESPLNSPKSASSAGVYRFEEYELDCVQWQLTWRDENVAIQRKSFDLLLYLLKERPRVVGKEEILEALWPNQYVDENNLARQISLLRKALSRHESESKVIDTVPGRGYKFVPEVEEITGPGTGQSGRISADIVLSAEESITRITLEEEIVADGLAERTQDHRASVAPSLPSPTPQRKPTTYTVWLIAAAALLMSLAAWFGWRWWQNHTGGEPVQVVLMPLEGSTGDTSLDHALGDAVRVDMAQSPFVSVLPASRVATVLRQMQRKPDEAIDLAVAREICERTNSQAVARTSLARDGRHYLLIGEVTGCVSGATVVATKRDADQLEALPPAIDKLINTMRRQLGESRRSIARFNIVLPSSDVASTSSLEALKAVAEGSRMAATGKFSDAINLYKRAIVYDPNYAMAYFNLSTAYSALLDIADSRKAIAKAHELRNRVGPQEAMTITARYETFGTGDLYAAEETYRAWTQMYPRSRDAWNGLNIVQSELGDHAGALISAHHAVELNPTAANLLQNLAEIQLEADDYAGAHATYQRALTAGIDGDSIRFSLIRFAYAAHDSALMQQQRDWLAQHPDSPVTVMYEAEISVSEGRFKDALSLLSRATDIYHRQGLSSAVSPMTKALAEELIEVDDREEGIQLFQSQLLDPADANDVMTLADIGELAQANRLLAAHMADSPDDTLWKFSVGPYIRAQNALAAQKPREAAELLEPTHALDGREYGVPDFRGNVHLLAGQPQKAEADFRYIVTHPNVEPTAPTIPMAWLGLGRALAAEGNRAAAKDAYNHFLHIWQHADANAALYQTAKSEAAALQQQ